MDAGFNEAEAFGRVGDGSPDPVAAIYGDHADRLHRRLLWLTRDAALAEDITHETFVRLIGEAQAGRMPENAGAWLYRVALNLLASGARRAKVADRYRSRLANPEIEGSPEEQTEWREQLGELSAALGRLGASDRTAIVLAARGLNGAEMAERMGRSEPATRTLLCRARTKLRADLLAS